MESYCGASMTFQNVHSFVNLLPESWLQFPNLHKPGDHAAILMFRKLNSKEFKLEMAPSLWAVQINLSQSSSAPVGKCLDRISHHRRRSLYHSLVSAWGPQTQSTRSPAVLLCFQTVATCPE
jgi:hypothetical protein